jgi:hypothetical protein
MTSTTYAVPSIYRRLFEPTAESITNFLYLWYNVESHKTQKRVNLVPASTTTINYPPLISKYTLGGEPSDLFPVHTPRPIAITPDLEEIWDRHVPALPLRDALVDYVTTHVDPDEIALHAGQLHSVVGPFPVAVPVPSLTQLLAAPFVQGIEAVFPEQVETRPVPEPHVIRVSPDYTDTRKRAVTAQAYARRLSEATKILPLPDLYSQPGTDNLVGIPPSTSKIHIYDRRDVQSLIELSTRAAYPTDAVPLNDRVALLYVEEVDVPKKVSEYIAVGEASSDAPIKLEQPPLRRLVHYPFITPDGQLYDTPGYDPQTGTFLVPNPESEDGLYPRYQMDVRTAVRLLAKVFADFPFKHPVARSAGWSLLFAYPFSLTAPPDRKMPIPAHLVRATQQSSGKTNLTRLPQLVFTGSINEPISARGMADDEELTKELQTACADGAPIVGADNVVGMIRSSELAGLLTKPVHSFRKFGSNTDKLTLPTPALLTFNGNNLSIDVDLLRRFFVSDLLYDSATNPKYRTPDQFVTKTLDFEAFVRQNRHILAAATLRIVQETLRIPEADRSAPAVPLSNFETYQRLIYSAIFDVVVPNYPTAGEVQAHPTSPHPQSYLSARPLFADPTDSQDLAQADTRPADDLAKLFIEWMYPWISQMYDPSSPEEPIYVPTRDAAPSFQKALDRVNPLRDRLGREIFIDPSNMKRYLSRSEASVSWAWHESYDVPISGEPVLNALRQYGIGWEISFKTRSGNVSHVAFTPLRGIADPLKHFEELAGQYRADPTKVINHPVLGEIEA